MLSFWKGSAIANQAGGAIAEHGLDQGQRCHGGGVGPQDARPERQADHPWVGEQQPPFLIFETPFGADDNGDLGC
jgi:hypothetical protein